MAVNRLVKNNMNLSIKKAQATPIHILQIKITYIQNQIPVVSLVLIVLENCFKLILLLANLHNSKKFKKKQSNDKGS